MKKIWILIASAAVMTAAVSSCRSNEPTEQFEETAPMTVHFTSMAPGTRSAFGDPITEGSVTRYPSFWTVNDKSIEISLNYEYAVTAGVSQSETDGEGHITRVDFDASFSGIETSSPYTFYLVSPASAFVWPSSSREACSVTVPGTQTPSPGSVDEAAHIIVAKSEAYTTMPTSVEVDFSHITAYCKLFLTGLSLGEGVSVTSVVISTDDAPLSGSVWYKFTDGSCTTREASYSVVVNTSATDVAQEEAIWFACVPANLGGKELTIKANLSNGGTFSRTITLREGFSFTSGHIRRMSVDMSQAEYEGPSQGGTVYTLATSINDLSEGDELIIMNKSNAPEFAMTTASNGSGKGMGATSEGFTVSGNEVTVTSPNILVLAVASKSGNSMQFKNGDNYLGRHPSNGGSAWLALENRSGNVNTATVTFSNNKAIVNYKSDNYYNFYVRYSNNYFNVRRDQSMEYTCAIFRKSGTYSHGFCDDPVLGYRLYGAYLTTGNLVYNPGSDQLSREYSADGSLVTFSVNDPWSDKVLTFGGIPVKAAAGESFTLSFSYFDGTSSQTGRQYEVTVLGENGATLFLSDGKGNGFIVKR